MNSSEVRSWTAAAVLYFPDPVSGNSGAGGCKKFIRINKMVEVIDGDKWVRFEPYIRLQAEFHH